MSNEKIRILLNDLDSMEEEFESGLNDVRTLRIEFKKILNGEESEFYDNLEEALWKIEGFIEEYSLNVLGGGHNV